MRLPVPARRTTSGQVFPVQPRALEKNLVSDFYIDHQRFGTRLELPPAAFQCGKNRFAADPRLVARPNFADFAKLGTGERTEDIDF
ncbi:hypothetical protein MPTK1_8g15720 [Marchantia polymorpha subsp. ruderalis]|uniref:Uncharacterized protein n=1 Tax=Marchantia polymorpha TaxID=3197 RepID=A0A2R6WKZ5_MARPO|nr:hypothetical protein MARPO_0079s0041 [Marchantia polymorpha]BBN20017.1 hypothetical protein Mp_8g15720 [Marchantia polymorpha subsp. ruderalis]|eukprot:PTQ34536.1 hypothetical protein MARPO_0079s0041 [Marchantia polymorpha]